MIYFIMSGDLIKIGHSNNPRRRLQMLSTGCPFECHLIGVMQGGPIEETRVHEQFSHLRTKGEWFKFTVDLNSFIRENAVQMDSDKRATIDHPIMHFIAKSGQSVSTFCKRVGTSRVTLYRLIKGEQNATIDLLSKISAATGGEVPATVFLPIREAAE